MSQFGQDSHTARSHTRINFKRKGLGFTSVLCMCRGWEVVGGRESGEEGFKNNKRLYFLKDWVPGNSHV